MDSKFLKIEIPINSTLTLNFTLKKRPSRNAVAFSTPEHVVFNTNDGFLTRVQYKYRTNEQLFQWLRTLVATYRDIATIKSIGKSVRGQDLIVIVIGADPTQHRPGVPEFKYVANMHGDEVLRFLHRQ